MNLLPQFFLTNLLFFLQNFYSWPDEEYDEMDSTLVVQQFIQQSIRSKGHTNIEEILAAPESQDEGVWKYEHLRLVAIEYFNFHKYLFIQGFLFIHPRFVLLYNQ